MGARGVSCARGEREECSRGCGEGKRRQAERAACTIECHRPPTRLIADERRRGRHLSRERIGAGGSIGGGARHGLLPGLGLRRRRQLDHRADPLREAAVDPAVRHAVEHAARRDLTHRPARREEDDRERARAAAAATVIVRRNSAADAAPRE